MGVGRAARRREVARGLHGDADRLRRRRRQRAAERRPDAQRRDRRRSRPNACKEIGAWLAKYGESIYGTRGGPFKPGEYGVSTRKGNTIYVHIRNWDESTTQTAGRSPPRSSATASWAAAMRRSTQTAAGIEIGVAEQRPRMRSIRSWRSSWIQTRLASPLWLFPGAVSLAARARPPPPTCTSMMPTYGPDKAVDGDDETRWATDSGDHVGLAGTGPRQAAGDSTGR